MGIKKSLMNTLRVRETINKLADLKLALKSSYYLFRFPEEFIQNTSDIQDVKASAQLLLDSHRPDDESIYDFVHPHWQSRVVTFRPYLEKQFGSRFLRDYPAKDFVWCGGARYWHEKQFKEIDLNSSSRVRQIVKEYRQPRFGSPPNLCRFQGHLTGDKLVTPSAIDHFYYLHIIDSLASTSGVSSIKKYLEVGAGYGNMPYLIKCLYPNVTIVLIDLVETSLFQYAYLKHVLPGCEISYFHENGFSIKENAINIVTLNHIRLLDWKTEVFLSSFALTESTAEFRKFISERDFYQAQILFVTGGTDTRFSSDQNMQDAVLEKFSDPRFRESMQPGCYEILAHRSVSCKRPVIPS